ncbi:hypothetical protein QT971_18580 [Microcoleus sp. herbarium19]
MKKKEEGRRKKEEGRGKKERRKEERRNKILTFNFRLQSPMLLGPMTDSR